METYVKAEYLDIISNLVLDLSTEIDLHYETEDLRALTASFEALAAGAALLEQHNRPLPDAYAHIRTRYFQVRN
jgi:hypothetical protein